MAAGARARRGCEGLSYCCKVYLFDAMNILELIWNEDDKYARKAASAKEVDLDNKIGQAKVPNKSKVISKADYNEFCSLFSQPKAKTSDLPELPPALKRSIVPENAVDMRDLSKL